MAIGPSTNLPSGREQSGIMFSKQRDPGQRDSNLKPIWALSISRVCSAAAALAVCLALASPVSAEVVVRGVEGAALSEVRPAPSFLKPDVNIVTAQPSPSDINSAFLGPVLLMKQAQVDLEKGTARIPLRKGRLRSGELVWFVLTDTTDENLANLHGLNYSPKLAYGSLAPARVKRLSTVTEVSYLTPGGSISHRITA